MEEAKKSHISVNFTRLRAIVRADKRRMRVWIVVAMVVSVIVAFSIPRIYKTGVMLSPESSSNNSLMGSVSSLASMVGMDINIGDNNDAIYPEIYPDLMKSTNFTVALFPIRVKSRDGKIDTNYYDYLKTRQKQPFWLYPLTWLKKVMKHLRKTEPGPPGAGGVDPFWLTKDEHDISEVINRNIDCSVDKKTNVITIEVTDQDALIAATMADSVMTLLQRFITDYRTNKARNDLAYMTRLFDEAKEQYGEARRRYAAFSDANTDLLLESVKSEQEELENEMQLKYNIYTQVTEQLQLARAKVQERTPAFTVVQSATVAPKHSNKPKILILAAFVIIAVCLRLCLLMWRNRRTVFAFS